MFYKANLETIKQDLNFALLEKDRKIEALETILTCLDEYKRKQLNKYFNDLVESKAPKYSAGSGEDKREYAKFSVTTKNAYNMPTFEIYFSDRILKYKNESAYFSSYNETVYFPRNEDNSEYLTTPQDLKNVLLKRLEGMKEYKTKMQKELKTITKIYNEYNQLQTKLDKLTDNLTHIPRSGLKGDHTYNPLHKF